MKKMTFLIGFIVIMILGNIFLFSQTNNINNAYLDNSSQKYSDLMFVFNRDSLNNLYKSRFWNSETEEKNGTHYLTLALNLYNQEKYEESIDNYILAIKADRLDLQLYYYHLGVCLMDANTHFYELAKKSFQESIYYFFESDYNFMTYKPYGRDDLYSIDDNGIRRESYFTFYNIACIESLQNNIDVAYNYLCEALYYGYPYINHIRNDDDLRNLFRDRRNLQSIEAVYNAGSHDTTVRGKCFNLNIPAGYSQYIHFMDTKKLTEFIVYGDGQYYREENYRIRNYLVFSDAFRQAGFLYLKRFENKDYSDRRNYREISIEKMYSER
jgi:tetratricopeptide (TPR) repeat protein